MAGTGLCRPVKAHSNVGVASDEDRDEPSYRRFDGRVATPKELKLASNSPGGRRIVPPDHLSRRVTIPRELFLGNYARGFGNDREESQVPLWRGIFSPRV
jgi:hypothetical protein